MNQPVAINSSLDENNSSIDYSQVISDVKLIIQTGISEGYNAVNSVLVSTYWNIGKRIVEEEQNGDSRAEYGKGVLKNLAAYLSKEFGSAYSERNLRNFRQFYLKFPDIQIWYARVPNLKWTHWRSLLRVENDDARYWYMKEASEQEWSSRTLDRNINTQYYFRLLQSPKKENVIKEMYELTEPLNKDKNEFIKSPVVAEFLGFQNITDFTESNLEAALIEHLQKFIMELGKGYAFVARQKHIITDAGDYFIDLVFYNYELNCFVLFDLKIKQISHQDVGQMDMYVRMFDEKYMKNGHNPTIGVLLCTETSSDIAKYSILHDNDQIFAAKYFTYLPTQDELKREIEKQKDEFNLQNKSKGNDHD